MTQKNTQIEEKARLDALFQKSYDGLNQEQRRAVDTIEGPVMVVAGPGTGKTQILTLRIANILRESAAGIGPENILALTFTNAGVRAMRERLATFIGVQAAYEVGIYTFHSFAEEQMRRFPDFFPRFAFGRTITEVDRFRVLEEIIEREDLEELKTFASASHYVRDVARAIDELKNEGVRAQDLRTKIASQEKNILADEGSYYKRATKHYKKGDLKPDALKPVRKNKELAHVYELYQQHLEDKNLYEFSDMILGLLDAIRTHGDFHAALLEQYHYLLVDEHQDTNEGQSALLTYLTDLPMGDAPNLFTVGDDKQAIYRFQGASVENFLQFQEKFPEIEIIHLVNNYRSTQDVLDSAHMLISEDEGDREHQPLTAAGLPPSGSIDVHEHRTYRDELAFVARNIKAKIDAGAVPEEIALMYRKNAHVGDIVAALEREQVPYTISARVNLLEDVEMRKLLLMLRACARPTNEEVVGQMLLIDFLEVETIDVVRFLDALHHGRKQRLITNCLGDEKFLESVEGLRNHSAFTDLEVFLTTYKEKGDNMPFLEFFEIFVRESGFLEHILALPTHALHLKQIDALMREIQTQVEVKPQFRLSDFVIFIETLINYGVTIDTVADVAESGIQLMSAHKSKGLEFEHVYITNTITGVWDHARQVQKFKLPLGKAGNTRDDERRLFYVALTRAKADITITYAGEGSGGRQTTKSMFIDDLPAGLVTHHDHSDETTSIAEVFRPRHSTRVSIIDPDYMRDKFLTTPLSVSALNNFIKSPLLYFFRNLVRLPQAQTKSLLFGNVIHGAFELYFNDVAQAKTVLPVEKLLAYFDQVLDKTYLLSDHHAEIEKRGHTLLEGYYQQYSADFETNILSEEVIKTVPFVLDDGTEIMLTGIIDKMEVRPDGAMRVVDYKTGKPWSKKTKEDKAGLERQIVFYKLLLDSYKNQDGGQKYLMEEGVLDFVEPATKAAPYEREFFVVSPEQIENLKREINECARAVIEGTLLEGEFKRTRETEKYINLWEMLKK